MGTLQPSYLAQPSSSSANSLSLVRRDGDNAALIPRLTSFALRRQDVSVSRFLAQGSDQPSQIAEAAYRSSLHELDRILSGKERDQLRRSGNIQDVFLIIQDAREASAGSGKRRQIVEKTAQVLGHYSKSIDTICQHHPEYTALLWGSMRFLIQITMNYFELFNGLARIMNNIGDNLERFELYLQVYPTARMKEICYRLYAVIVLFYKDAIVFYKKSRWRKYLASFWSPFEVKFKGAVNEIERLERVVERDAVATGLIQLQQGLSAMAEWALGGMDCQNQILEDMRRREVFSMLSDFRKEIFIGREGDATYYEDILNRYRTTATSDWDQWFATERKHVTWEPASESNLIHMQTDISAIQISCKWIALGQALAGSVPFANLVWSSSMTAKTAVASMILQILQQRPDMLHPESDLHARVKSRNARTFPELWKLFQDILQGLPGLLCYITIPSTGAQEEAFAVKVVELFDSWQGCPINMQLVTPTHSNFPRASSIIDIDTMYDVSPDLDSPDALHHVVLAELELPEPVSLEMNESLWQSMWRTVCYSINALALGQLRRAFRDAAEDTSLESFGDYLDPDDLIDWVESRVGEFHLPAHLQHCVDCLPFMLPNYLRGRFQARLRLEVLKHVPIREGPAPVHTTKARNYEFPRDIDDRQTMPSQMEHRKSLWREMQRILDYSSAELFSPFIRSQLRRKARRRSSSASTARRDSNPNLESIDPSQIQQDFIAEIFSSSSEWTKICTDAGYQYREAVLTAIELGLSRTAHSMLYHEQCGCPP